MKGKVQIIWTHYKFKYRQDMFLPILLKYIYKEGRELKFIIITFIAIFIIMDIVMIFGSSVVKKIQKRKRRKAFSKKMKNLEIK